MEAKSEIRVGGAVGAAWPAGLKFAVDITHGARSAKRRAGPCMPACLRLAKPRGRTPAASAVRTDVDPRIS